MVGPRGHFPPFPFSPISLPTDIRTTNEGPFSLLPSLVGMLKAPFASTPSLSSSHAWETKDLSPPFSLFSTLFPFPKWPCYWGETSTEAV